MDSVIFVEVENGIIKKVSENLKSIFGVNIEGKRFNNLFVNISGNVYETVCNDQKYYYKIVKDKKKYFLCDITDEYKSNKILNLLQISADVLINAKNEDDIFSGLMDVFSNYTLFSCFLKKNENKLQFHICPKIVGKYKEIESLFYLKNNECQIINTFLKNRILIFKDIEKENCLSKKLKEFLQKFSIKYLTVIPIYKRNIPYGVVLLVSKYKNEFKNELFFFDKLKKLIEFSLEKLDELSMLTLIKNAIDKEYSWIVITDEKANIIYANKAVSDISGYKLEELLGKNPRVFKSGIQSKKFYDYFWKKLTKGEIFEGVFINKKKNGELFYLKDKIFPVTTPDGKKYYMSIATDISNEYKLKRKITKIKYYDTLTGLLNRDGFIDKLSVFLNPGEKYAIAVIDIKDFKVINQVFSKDIGDNVLLKISDTLKKNFPDNLIARVGADDFAVCIQYDDLSKLYHCIEKILYIFNNIHLDGIDLSVNIGISLFPKDDIDSLGLLEKAFIALEYARQKGENEFDFYNRNIYKLLLKYQEGRKIISYALKNNDFIYYFHPYVDSKSGKIVGAESLLRARYKNRIVLPEEFIDYAEKSGKIKEIEKKMFCELVKMVKEINIPLSFNISGKSLNDKKHIFNLFKNVKNLPILIELTEREIVLNLEYSKKLFEFFKAKDLKISIDDFGTGYSSLAYIKDIPAEYLKIDTSFVKNLEHSSKDVVIVETIINFAHKLGMKTIVEGVENAKQVEILKKIGCDYMQGFYFYEPMPFEQLKKVVRQSLEGES